MSEEVVRLAMNAVVCEDIGLVCEGAHHIQGDFCLRNKFVPEVDSVDVMS